MVCMTDDVVFDTAAGPEMFGRRIEGAADVKAAFERVWADMPMSVGHAHATASSKIVAFQNGSSAPPRRTALELRSKAAISLFFVAR